MEFKVFTRGTYFYIIDENEKEYEGLKKDVRVRRLGSNSSEFYFDNINGWTDPKGGVHIANILKEDGSPYSLSEFIEFKESETGNFNTGEESPQETETNIVAIADGYSYTNENGEIVNITQKRDISDLNNQKIETLVNGVKVFEFPLYTINNDVQIDNNASEWNFTDDQITILETNGDTQVLNFPYRVSVLVNPDGSIAIRQNNITIGNVPAPAVDASATQIGLVNLQNQTLGAGVKTFTSDIIANGVNIGRGSGNIASNIIIGVGLLTNNTTGIQNVVIGVSSMQANTSGTDNFALGSFTLRSNTIGTRNVGIGNSTIRDSIEASRNVAIGNGTLQRNISGSNNTAIGDTAGTFDSLTNPVTIAINSIFLGHNSKPLANNQSNQIVIGQNATGLGDNSVVLGNNSISLTRLNGRVGVNTSNPIGALQVDSTTGAFVPPRLTSAQRDLLVEPLIGSVIFNTTTNTLQTLNSNGWVDNSGGSSQELFAIGSILSANACVGSVVNIPNGNQNDIKTVGTGGDFADLQTALADASVVNDTILKVISNLTTSTTINVNKAVVIDGNGFELVSDTANPVTMLNVTAGATIKDFSKISHLKTTNTSVETVISINSPTAPVYVYNNTIELQEFGIVTRGSFFIGRNTFKYVGASLTNSHRFIMLYGNSGESRIYENDFECSVMPATTRYSNFIYATSTTGTVYEGKLFINNNTQTAGNLRQFYLHDSGVPNNMELYVANNTFNDFNGGIGIFGIDVYNGYKKIGIYNNTQGADSAGNYKGLLFVDGTGAINESVVLEWGDNILANTALRTDYISYLEDGSSEVAIKNTITFIAKKVKVSLKNALSDFGFLVQELKGLR
jgi:hypothetical protein